MNDKDDEGIDECNSGTNPDGTNYNTSSAITTHLSHIITAINI